MHTSTQFAQWFRAVIETGNYTRAAKQLGVTPAAVSKSVAKQEAALGVQLLRRTTRNMMPTQAGQRYYEQSCRALALLEEAERSIAAPDKEPGGVVRVSMPTTFGHYRLLPWIPAFLARFPRIRLELDISHGNVDFVGDGFDVAVRMGSIADSSLIVRKLEDAPFAAFASPAYLARHAEPQTPAELRGHRCITFVRPSTGRALPWGFLDNRGKAFEIVPAERIDCSGDVLACVTLARAGAGLVQTYRFLVEEDVKQGRLVEVLKRFNGRSNRFSLLRAARRIEDRATKTFADALIEHCTRERA